MCTLTWWDGINSWGLLFNRDEQRARSIASPPACHVINGRNCIYPVDGQSQGTWICAREDGLIFVLLNYYDATMSPRSEGFRTRGEIIPHLMALSQSHQGVDFGDLYLKNYAPFHLLRLIKGCGAHWIWDGETLSSPPIKRPFLTTSSVDSTNIFQKRALGFQQCDSTIPASLEKFHRETDSAYPACGVCMDREDARTVSLTRIDVFEDRLEMRYEARDPEGHGFLDAEHIVLMYGNDVSRN